MRPVSELIVTNDHQGLIDANRVLITLNVEVDREDLTEWLHNLAELATLL